MPNADTEWPQEVREKYEKLRLLGQGAFGGIYLAQSKDTKETDDGLVAIKCIGVETETAASTAEREIAILEEMNHPNVIRLIRAFDAKDAVRYVVMTVAKGPTTNFLLNKGGAFGLPLAKTFSMQIVEAVTYLHSRAVIHRDLKPNNVIVVGGHSSDRAIWSDEEDAKEAVAKGRWKVMLIDFGFARALTPDQFGIEKENKDRTRDTGLSLNHALQDTSGSKSGVKTKSFVKQMSSSLHGSIHGSRHGSDHGASNHSQMSLSRSFSRRIIRGMSAIGSQNYAAPEVKDGVRKDNSGKAHSDCVSDYSIVADAFSLGSILRYVYTGVPPEHSVEDYIAMQNNPVAVLCKLLTGCSNKNKQEYRYRHNDEVPKDIAAIIRGLTDWDKTKRTSARAAYLRLTEFDEGFEPSAELASRKIGFLDCAKTMPIECEETED